MLIRFVPEVEHIPNENKSKFLTVKFKISSTVEKMYKGLVEGGTEAFINHIKVHKKGLADCKVKEEAVTVSNLILANRCNIATLTVAGSLTNKETNDNLVEANRELDETVCTFQKDAFDYFQKLLSPALAVK